MNKHHPTLDEATQRNYLRRFLWVLKQFVNEEMEVRSGENGGISNDDMIELIKQAQATPGFQVALDKKTCWYVSCFMTGLSSCSSLLTCFSQ